eukprot:6180043-Pleurochrysis_carterae.AAC.6
MTRAWGRLHNTVVNRYSGKRAPTALCRMARSTATRSDVRRTGARRRGDNVMGQMRCRERTWRETLGRAPSRDEDRRRAWRMA